MIVLSSTLRCGHLVSRWDASRDCVTRVTHPEDSRHKKASGGGNASMAEVCPRRCPPFKVDVDSAEFSEATPASSYVDPLIFTG
jgi:hypothetical protein